MLAVVAIFYTMIQGFETNQVLSSVRERLDQLSNQTGELLKLRPVLDSVSESPQPEALAQRSDVQSKRADEDDEGDEVKGEVGAYHQRRQLNYIVKAQDLIRKILVNAIAQQKNSGPILGSVEKDHLIETARVSGVDEEDAIRAIKRLMQFKVLVPLDDRTLLITHYIYAP